MDTCLIEISAVSFSLKGHDLSGIVYSVPRPLLLVLLVSIAVWISGMLYRSRKILQGNTTAFEFALVLISLLFAAFMIFIIARVSFAGFGLP